MEPNQPGKPSANTRRRTGLAPEDLADAQFFQTDPELIATIVAQHTGRAFAPADMESVERRKIPNVDAYLLFFKTTCLGMVYMLPPGRPANLPSFVFTPVPE